MKQAKQNIEDGLRRYTNSSLEAFQPYLLLTNFPKYLTIFKNLDPEHTVHHEGSMFQVVHNSRLKISFLNFGLGSPAAALAVDLLSCLPLKGVLFLGMAGGLRSHYVLGDYFIPIASIRAEGTSDYYYPSEVPALSNFLMNKAVSHTLTKMNIDHHFGVSFTTNKRFWEFNDSFVENLKKVNAQVIEMESATLFSASYSYKIPLGAMFLISDLPLHRQTIKTEKSSKFVMTEFAEEHIQIGINCLQQFHKILEDRKHLVSRKDLMPPHPDA